MVLQLMPPLPLPLLPCCLHPFSACSWIDAGKFLTGFSAVGSIAIPAILAHAQVRALSHCALASVCLRAARARLWLFVVARHLWRWMPAVAAQQLPHPLCARRVKLCTRTSSASPRAHTLLDGTSVRQRGAAASCVHAMRPGQSSMCSGVLRLHAMCAAYGCCCMQSCTMPPPPPTPASTAPLTARSPPSDARACKKGRAVVTGAVRCLCCICVPALHTRAQPGHHIWRAHHGAGCCICAGRHSAHVRLLRQQRQHGLLLSAWRARKTAPAVHYCWE